jgi:biopolymer transport protein ExbB
MEFSFGGIWANMSMLAKGVAGVLLVMAIISLGVFIERLIAFARANTRSRLFAAKSAGPMGERQWSGVLDACAAFKGTPLADLVAFSVNTWQKGRQDKASGKGTMDPNELLRRALERQLETMSSDLRRGFSALASVGSVAPFVGLFGTVVGIINAFEGIARTGSGGLGSVSAGIAEALVVTAFGLAVAIPAVLAFNFLTTRADRLDLALSTAAGELADHLEQASGARDAREAPAA